MADNVIGFAFGVDTRIARNENTSQSANRSITIGPIIRCVLVYNRIRLSSWLLAIQIIDSLISG